MDELQIMNMDELRGKVVTAREAYYGACKRIEELEDWQEKNINEWKRDVVIAREAYYDACLHIEELKEEVRVRTGQLDRASLRIEELDSMCEEWHEVKNTPPISTRLLITDGYTVVCGTYFDKSFSSSSTDINDSEYGQPVVTHWMIAPKPPV